MTPADSRKKKCGCDLLNATSNKDVIGCCCESLACIDKKTLHSKGSILTFFFWYTHYAMINSDEDLFTFYVN